MSCSRPPSVHYVLSVDYNKYMDFQQNINLRLHRELQQRDIEFAYPTQKLYVVSEMVEGNASDDAQQDRIEAATASRINAAVVGTGPSALTYCECASS